MDRVGGDALGQNSVGRATAACAVSVIQKVSSANEEFDPFSLLIWMEERIMVVSNTFHPSFCIFHHWGVGNSTSQGSMCWVVEGVHHSFRDDGVPHRPERLGNNL